MSPNPLTGLAARRLGGRVTPWITYYRVARQVLDRGRGGWNALTATERRDLTRILRDSRGRPAAVSPADRARLRAIVTKAGKGVAKRPRKA